ncbi:hypothetical protein KCU61_g521, partial [Aureobasidium melanogenum]
MCNLAPIQNSCYPISGLILARNFSATTSPLGYNKAILQIQSNIQDNAENEGTPDRGLTISFCTFCSASRDNTISAVSHLSKLTFLDVSAISKTPTKRRP